MFNKTVSYSIPEFLQMLREKELMKQLGLDEKIAGIILMNRKLKKVIVLALAMVFSAQRAYASEDKVGDALNKVDKAGWTLLKIVRKGGYWICIILCIVEIIKCLVSGDTRPIGKIVAKYGLAFAVLYLLPWLFDIIVACFG